MLTFSSYKIYFLLSSQNKNWNMKKLVILILFISSFNFYAQNTRPPVYHSCEDVNDSELEACFLNNLKEEFLAEFIFREKTMRREKVLIIFTLSKKGEYIVNYINSSYKTVSAEIMRVFETIPLAKPAIYNGHNIDSQYVFSFYIPLSENFVKEVPAQSFVNKTNVQTITSEIQTKKNELKQFPELNTSLSIPFTHQQYSLINKYANEMENEHSAVKPYFYNESKAYIKVASDKTSLFKKTDSGLGNKIWNENLFYVKGKNYWFTVNPIFDWQLGKDNSDNKYTFNNTRAVNVRGSIGKLSFSSSIYESQGRFAKYVNDYTRTLKPADMHAVFLGAGNAKKFKDTSFDYPIAEGYISYNANEHFNLQFGKGKNFIGDGYRSLFLSDAASPYTFAKISTNFWKVKYTNIWMWTNDVRADSFSNNTYLRKYVAAHHLSINLTKKLNIGLFESTITNARSNATMDIEFVNPIIFYRTVEFSRGSESGNAIVGLNAKYKFQKGNIYGQFVLDELVVGEILKKKGSLQNKYGFQLGFHYYDAFKIANLSLQGEANVVRPYTYAHRDTELNYSHFYQPLAHSWGSNFVELVGIARYHKGRYFGSFKGVYGKKGFDYQDDATSYGGNIFVSINKGKEDDNTYFQGNKANILIADLQLGYVINPTTNLSIFANASIRSFKADESIPYFTEENTTWFTVGLKTDVFNSYFDF